MVDEQRGMLRDQLDRGRISCCGVGFVRQGFGNLWTLRDLQPSDSSIYLYLTLEVF